MKSKRALVKYRGEECLNCGRSLEEEHKFCPSCGQLNSTKKLALGDFFSEFFSGLFAYDSRFIRTMRVLLFKPGKISKDYIHGKRMRYVNPYRFFLTTAIVFFLIYGYDTTFDGLNLDKDPEDITTEFVQLDSIIKSSKKKSYKDYLVTQQQIDTMSINDAQSRR